jgi:thiamine kinase-like enzyme
MTVDASDRWIGTSDLPWDQAEVAARLASVPELTQLPRRVERLSGGLTNVNLKVTTPAGSYVARLYSSDGSLLAIDRDAEFHNTSAAAAAGVGASVLAYRPDARLLAVGFLPGRTYEPADLSDHDNLTRIAAAIRQLHEGPRFQGDFDMFELQQRYLDTVQKRGFRLPPRYEEFLPQVERIHAALMMQQTGTVPCNNDLLAGNFIDDGKKIWLIDYEYSGNNDACFELGNVWSESTLGLDELEHLVTTYYGRRLRNRIARARLLGLMSKYGWTLWASIQDGASTLDFDFWEWGMEKYDRAVSEFDGPDFDRLLDEAARAD